MPRGLLMDFGGVLSTDQFDALQGFCVREGVSHTALRPLLSGMTSHVVELELGRLASICRPSVSIGSGSRYSCLPSHSNRHIRSCTERGGHSCP